MQPTTLAPGFVSIDDAVALIKSDTREKPVVDMDYLVSKIVWIEVNHYFRLSMKTPATCMYLSTPTSRKSF